MKKRLLWLMLSTFISFVLANNVNAQDCSRPSSYSTAGFALGIQGTNNPTYAYDNDPSSSAELHIFSTVAGYTSVTYTWASAQTATDSISFDMMLGFQLSPSLGGVTFQAYDANGNPVGSSHTLATFIFSLNQEAHDAYVPGGAFKSVTITMVNLSFISAQSAYVYDLKSSPRAPVLTTQATPSTQCISTTGTANLSASLDATYSDISRYYWFSSVSDTAGISNAIAGASAATYTTPSLTNGTYTYYVKVRRNNCPLTTSKAYPVTFSIWKYPSILPANGTILPTATRNTSYTGSILTTDYGTFTGFTQSPTGAGFTMNTGGTSAQITATNVSGTATAGVTKETVTVSSNNNGCITTNTYSIPFVWSLPVSYAKELSATQSNNNVYLKWTTANEINNKGFSVEHSVDGISYTVIGFVASKVNNGNGSDYDFTDSLPAKGTNFYRLVQTDLDGRTETSNVVNIQIASGRAIALYPNPAHGFVTVSGIEQGSSISVISLDGRIVKSLVATSDIQRVDLSQLSAGIYILKVMTKGHIQSIKFLVN